MSNPLAGICFIEHDNESHEQKMWLGSLLIKVRPVALEKFNTDDTDFVFKWSISHWDDERLGSEEIEIMRGGNLIITGTNEDTVEKRIENTTRNAMKEMLNLLAKTADAFREREDRAAESYRTDIPSCETEIPFLEMFNEQVNMFASDNEFEIYNGLDLLSEYEKTNKTNGHVYRESEKMIDNNELMKIVEELKGKVDGLEAEISLLSLEKDLLTNDYDFLQERNDALEDEISALTDANSDLEDRLGEVDENW